MKAIKANVKAKAAVMAVFFLARYRTVATKLLKTLEISYS
ncbi:hypothetical protein RNAN_0719 [Rheinheimera nanhaiensis E407-8]|uniref:Uncharacterized protein n=1 Tax=Rheinheimera nanhaiensis E407-8 TaxID=562729 RepID=I1DUM2_9GAMM|nr:hypothetical protein RNAN_0719 [Rheinheimera nanhaiensis E407-8]